MLLSFISKNKYLIFILPFFIYFISFFNTWYFADDHEIPLFFNYLKDHSILETIQITEVSMWGEFKRFRPTYYSIRVLESWLWQDQLYLWYLVRLIIQFFFLKEIYHWASQKLSKNEAIVTTFLVLSMIFWRDLQTRLAPAETYCVLGLTLISISLRKDKFKFLYFLGAFIAMGSKENFVILPAVLIAYHYGFKKISKIDYFYNLILTLFACFIALGIYKAIAQTGSDIYMSKVDPLNRFLTLAKGLLTFQLIPYLVLLGGWFRKKITMDRFDWTIFLIMGFILLTNILFYNGEIPRGNRYDFPAVPLNIAVWIMLYLKYPLPLKFQKILIAGLALMIFSGIYRQTTKAFQRHSETAKNTKQIFDLANKADRKKPLVFVTDDTKDYEMGVLFVPRMLRHYGFLQKFYFRPIIAEQDSALKKALKIDMEGISIGKGTNFSPVWKTEFSPFSELNDECLQVNLKPTIKQSFCQESIYF